MSVTKVVATVFALILGVVLFNANTHVRVTNQVVQISGRPAAAPPRLECQFPSRDEIRELRTASSLIAQALSLDQVVKSTPGGPVSSYRVLPKKILAGESIPGTPLRIVVAGGRPRSFLDSGNSYILFLRKADSGVYSTVEGFKGRFTVEDDRVYMFCPAGEAEPLREATGSGISVGSFEAMVRDS